VNDRSATTKRDLDERDVTAEVGGEGGSAGNIETGVTRDVGTGSEAGETWRPADVEPDTVVRDETGEGRRNP
jgi:hypothetical protein